MREKLIIILQLCLVITAFAQPSNDDCTNIIDLGIAPYCSDPAQFTNIDATASTILPNNIPDCFNGGGVQRDVWFQFTVPPDGSITDFAITVTGNDAGNGTLQNPQAAIYRGDCPNDIDMLACASAANGVNTVTVDAIGLTPGLSYFIRVNDYSSTAASNAGTFQLCVSEYVASFNMGQAPGSIGCSGTLYDSGGPNNDYNNDENLSFVICPQEFHQCIILNVNYETEDNFDFIRFIQGDAASDPQIIAVSGANANFTVQVPGDCATIVFDSDGSGIAPGFTLTWSCSSSPCTTPPISTCDDPTPIAALPYTNSLDNCFSGNSIPSDPCGSDFVLGNDYIFTYTSNGNECITVSATGTNGEAGLGVYSDCPTTAGAQCISIQDANLFGGIDPVIESAFLEAPGTYYLVFGTLGDCSPFNISVDTITCPIVLPPASTCDQALSIGGCSTLIPQIIALNPGEGDADFIQDGVNQGCFVAPQFNYSFFYFKAGADGKFGFTCEAANPAEASDIDINVWGPIDNFEDICDFTSTNQPVRSTWAALAVPTGLEDIHPGTGIAVTDEFDCGDPSTPGAAGDNFVRRLDVIKDKYYVVMLDDFGEAIESGGIAIDFGGTTAGVLSPEEGLVSISPDTTICLGQSVNLNATGGAAYFWSPTASLSCSQCPSPTATPFVPTTYEVSIVNTCSSQTLEVNVDIFDLTLGSDVTVCSGATFQLNENGPSNATYTWSGPALSCNNCPTPTVGPLTPGTYTYIASLFSTFCLFKDTLVVTVLPAPQPQYIISPDVSICAGESVQLGGVAQPGTSYSWSSAPAGFNASTANPTVTPTSDITYYLSATNGSCPVTALDSVVVSVSNVPLLSLTSDTSICVGQPVQLGLSLPQNGVTFGWSSNVGTMSQPTALNPVETPEVSTVYTITATLGTCTINRQVNVQVVPLLLQLNVPDSFAICQGKSVDIQVNISPAGTPVTWSPLNALTVAPNGLSAIATPEEFTTYTITSSLNGCNRELLVKVAVDSLPADLDIYPADTTVCQGSQVLLKSPIYEPGEYQYMDFEWTPPVGQITPDSLFNMVISASESLIYRRITRNGACVDTAFATINVIVPPQISINPPVSSVCPGVPVPLTASVPGGVTDLSWSPALGLSCTNCPTPVATATTTTVYTLTGEYESCPVSASAIINIETPPALQFPGDVQLCKGESVVLNGVVTPNTTYTWTSSDPAFGGSTEAQPNVTPTLATTTYSVSATNGCPASGSVTIFVADASLTVSNDTSVCRNEPVQLTAMGNLAGTFEWSNGQTAQTFTENIGQPTTYTVTYSFGDGCTLTESVVVGISGESVPLDLPDPVQICPGNSITLNEESVPTGATYVWTATPTDPTLATSAGNPTVAPTANTTYTVVATLGNCTTTRTVAIGVASGSLSAPADVTICSGDGIALNATASPGTLLWSSGQTTASITVAPLATTTYSVALVYGNNCVLNDSVQVTVTPGFNLSIVAAPSNANPVDVGDQIELTANITPGANLQQYTFEWLENGVTNVGNTQIINPTVSTSEDTIRYEVTATSPNGCVRFASIGFAVDQPVVDVPNAFTPGNDTINNTFKLIFVEGNGIIEKLEVYSRWGQKVFNSTADIKEWDGTVDGKPAPMDTYVYRIIWRRLDGALQTPISGEVTLIR